MEIIGLKASEKKLMYTHGRTTECLHISNKEPEDQWSCKRSPDILA